MHSWISSSGADVLRPFRSSLGLVAPVKLKVSLPCFARKLAVFLGRLNGRDPLSESCHCKWQSKLIRARREHV
jgi:hypothetical protein